VLVRCNGVEGFNSSAEGVGEEHEAAGSDHPDGLEVLHSADDEAGGSVGHAADHASEKPASPAAADGSPDRGNGLRVLLSMRRQLGCVAESWQVADQRCQVPGRQASQRHHWAALLLGQHQRHVTGTPMTTGDRSHRSSGWDAMQRNLVADDVVAEAVLYASGGRRLTVEHGQPLTEGGRRACAAARRRRRRGRRGCWLPGRWDRDRAGHVDHLDLPVHRRARGSSSSRPGSLPDRLNPGDWITAVDDYA